MFSFDCHMARTNIQIIDLLAPSVLPPHTSIFFNASHMCAYILWRVNILQHIRMTWVHGECV